MISEIKGMQIGLIVDSVQDVINMPISSIQDTPHFSTEYQRRLHSGSRENG
jgi:chemotaxis signal transduction protein